MVDRQRVLSLLQRLQEERDQLAELAHVPTTELRSDRVRLSAAKYGFIVSIETCIDIAQHIIASERLRAPQGYADTFAILVEAELLPVDLEEPMKAMAGFRNLLIHEYAQIDDDRVIEILRERLGDLDRFAASIAAIVDLPT